MSGLVHVLLQRKESAAWSAQPELVQNATRVLTYRDRPLQTAVVKAVSGGCDGVVRIPGLAVTHAATGS